MSTRQMKAIMWRFIATIVALFVITPIALGAPVYDDLWDISKGSSFFGGTFGGWHENVFGAWVGGPEPGHSIGLEKEMGHIGTIIWQTPNPLIVTGFVLNLASDVPGGYRQASHFTLKVNSVDPPYGDWSSVPAVFSQGIDPYLGSREIVGTLAAPATGSYFCAEFTWAASGEWNGPRVIELDAVATVVPEPGTMLLIGSGLAGLAVFKRVRRRHG